MKFEFIEFYETTDENKSRFNKKILGTVHIYAIDCELDIRGIRVFKQGKKIYFNFPHFNDIDSETGDKVSYPFIRFTSDKIHQEMMNFLKTEVITEIINRLKIKDQT